MATQVGLIIIGTCPAFQHGISGRDYIEKIRAAAMRAERQGWSAMLVYSDHKQFDPWLAANCLMNCTAKISPLVAIQPLYMHPFTVAKAMVSLEILYERPIHLNFISGGFPRDLETFCDYCTHAERYDRVAEYGEIIRKLLNEKRPCMYQGKYYQVDGLQLQLKSTLPNHCAPMFTISGSSPAGLAVARRLDAQAIQYLRPWQEFESTTLPAGLRYGARLGIVSRDTTERAWAVAKKQYPDDSLGREIREYYVRMSDSVWVKELAREVVAPADHPYWLGPYKNNQAACPFLVGARADVARELVGYIGRGFKTFLLEEPASDEDAEEIKNVFELAERIVVEQRSS